jgi:hypothetical protein
MTHIRSSSVWYGSRSLRAVVTIPPEPASGVSESDGSLWSFLGIEELIEERFTFKKTKVLPHFTDIQRRAVCPQQGANIFQILRSPRIVHQALQFECDQLLNLLSESG